ncbi:hypothetical protein [Empedobacter sp.]|uniref:hypothetical protein n=1 Tax=Empedobacter sp. TaxID=1927715 RepID=UPI002898BC2E|nr:hypothetical protein [Empedobacter sp.]
MILNGKAKEDFKKWYIETYDLYDSYDNELKLMSDTCLNALIIDFFDSVEIHICVTLLFPIYIYGWSYSIDLGYCYEYFKTRQEATEQAIKKANDLYNSRL